MGWLGGAGSLGGGGGLRLERGAEVGSRGAGLAGDGPTGRGFICGFKFCWYCVAVLLWFFWRLLPIMVRRKIGSESINKYET